MEKKKSKVQTVVFSKEISNSFGTSYLFDVGFENGDKGSYFSKDKEQKTFRQGQEAEYTIEEKTNGQYKNYVVKPVQNGFGGGFPKGNPVYEHRRVALKCAVDLVAADKIPLKDVSAYAESFMKFLNQ